MNRIVNNITELIGDTPILRLNNVVDENSAEVYVKLESFNPAGSIKDRIAMNMIEMAEKNGDISKGDTLVEPTSGNTGIGIGMVAAAKGYKVVITMPDTMSVERRNIMKAYGAELILTDGSKGMSGAIEKALELSKTKGYFYLKQFENVANPQIHKLTTAKEIIQAFDGKLDAFIASVGTGGTITGCGEVLKKHIKGIQIIAVEPSTSAVLSGEQKGAHKIQGIGAGFIPKVLNTNIYDKIIKVSDEEAFEMAHKIVKKEGLFVGISSGASIFAALKIAKELGRDKKVLVISPDAGEKYLSTELVI